MSDRSDTHYVFSLRSGTGTLGDLLKQLQTMPWDNTTRITDAHSWPHDDKFEWDYFDSREEGKTPGDKYLDCRGAMLKVEFSALWVCDYKSSPLEWVEKYIANMPATNPFRVSAAVFAVGPDDDDGHVFGAPRWDRIATTEKG